MTTIEITNVTHWTESTLYRHAVGELNNITEGPNSYNGRMVNLGLPVDQGPMGIVRQTYFCLVACSCLLGNGLTLYAVATTERLKTKEYAITTSLSFADFMYGLRLCIIIGYGIVSGDACTSARSRSYVRPVEKFFDQGAFFNVGSVAIDRFIAVIYPLH